jgi:hypothetical protein
MRRADLRESRLALCRIADREHDLGASARQAGGGTKADPAVGARHHSELPGQVG